MLIDVVHTSAHPFDPPDPPDLDDARVRGNEIHPQFSLKQAAGRVSFVPGRVVVRAARLPASTTLPR